MNQIKKNLLLAGTVLLMLSCSSTQKVTKSKSTKSVKSAKPVLLDDNTFLLTGVSADKKYGLTPEKPVEVGGAMDSEGPRNERRFLNALSGPNGEKVHYFRAGSCCPVESENGFMGMAMLDNYRVTWEGSKDTLSIFINMYDAGELKAPVGFSIKK